MSSYLQDLTYRKTLSRTRMLLAQIAASGNYDSVPALFYEAGVQENVAVDFSIPVGVVVGFGWMTMTKPMLLF